MFVLGYIEKLGLDAASLLLFLLTALSIILHLLIKIKDLGQIPLPFLFTFSQS